MRPSNAPSFVERTPSPMVESIDPFAAAATAFATNGERLSNAPSVADSSFSLSTNSACSASIASVTIAHPARQRSGTLQTIHITRAPSPAPSPVPRITLQASPRRSQRADVAWDEDTVQLSALDSTSTYGRFIAATSARPRSPEVPVQASTSKPLPRSPTPGGLGARNFLFPPLRTSIDSRRAVTPAPPSSGPGNPLKRVGSWFKRAMN